MIRKILITALILIAGLVKASDITVVNSCVVNSISATCSTPVDVFNNSGKNVCLWRTPSSGKPLEIFGCKSPATANWSDSWDNTTIDGDEIELKSHIGWPTQDPLGQEHAYAQGILLDSKIVTAEYGKITLPPQCTISNTTEQCTTEITVEKYGPMKLCLWRATSGQSPLVFGCISAPQTAWKRNWTQTSYAGDLIQLRAHDNWPANDPNAYQNSLLLDSKFIQAQLNQPEPSIPTLTSVYTSCDHKFCITAKGQDFADDASVLARENTPGSVSVEFSGNDIYKRTFTEIEDSVFFPIQNIAVQNQLKSPGLCFRVKNGSTFSNELCTVRPPTDDQPRFMGEIVQSYVGQDPEYTSFLVRGDAFPLQGGNVLKFLGNSWKKIYYNHNVTENTLLQFSFKSNQQEPEISGIGFILNGETTLRVNTHFWQVYGTQNKGQQQHHNYSGDSFKSYSIPIGQYFTGQISHMVFLADEDTHVGQRTVFKNPKLVENITNGTIGGALESVDDDFIRGWACQGGNPGLSLQVKLYSTHAFSDECIIIDNKQVCLIGIGNSQTSQASSCGIVNENGFSIPTPSVIKNGGNHDVYAVVSSTTLAGASSYSFYTQGYSPYWDSGLSERCVKRALGNPVTGFQDLSGCSNPSNNYYSIALQAEQSYGNRCSVDGDAYGASINGKDQGAFQFYWTEDSNNLTANLVSDLANYPHPCGSDDGDNVWNWYVFGLRGSESGTPFPLLKNSGVHFTAKLNYSLLSPGSNTRFFAICSGHYDSSFKRVVINFERTNQADNVPDDPEVVNITPTNTPYINYLGEKLGFDSVVQNQEMNYFVNCGSVFKHAIDRGYLEEPTDWNQAKLDKVFIGHELHNTTITNSGTTFLELKNYRIVEINE